MSDDLVTEVEVPKHFSYALLFLGKKTLADPKFVFDSSPNLCLEFMCSTAPWYFPNFCSIM